MGTKMTHVHVSFPLPCQSLLSVCVEFSTVCLSQDIMSPFTSAPPHLWKTHTYTQITSNVTFHRLSCVLQSKQTQMTSEGDVCFSQYFLGHSRLHFFMKRGKKRSLYNILIVLHRFIGAVLVEKGAGLHLCSPLIG